MTRQKALRYLTLPNGIVGMLAVVAALGCWYVINEDGRVGSAYATIFQHHPTLLPSNLVPLAALHIQTATTIAQACLTVALAIACTRDPNRSDISAASHSQELAQAIQLLATVLSDVAENRVGPHSSSSKTITSGDPHALSDVELASQPRAHS